MIPLLVILTACSPVDKLLNGSEIPKMPDPEIATYVLDLSGSTNPVAQFESLGSGIDEFTSGSALGNPFAEVPAAPRGLSLQFVTKNSAQAPRIQLVSSKSGTELFNYVKEKAPNNVGAEKLWTGIVSARKQLWEEKAFELTSTECVKKTIVMMGIQQLSDDNLQEPARILCNDARQTDFAKKKLDNFIKNPNVAMGSDVKGAIDLSLKNMLSVKKQYPTARMTLVVASDLIDEIQLKFPILFAGKSNDGIIDLASEKALNNNFAELSEMEVVLVGARNSVNTPEMMDKANLFWTNYFYALGITNISEQSDLMGF